MQTRPLGRTGFQVTTVSFGAWAIGGTWGAVSDDESMAALRRAVELGVNLFDTADVYGDGRSEQLLARLRRDVRTPIYIATKAGRRAQPHVPAAYHLASLTGYIERSLRNLDVEAIDLLQLHCPPTDVYYMPEVFDGLDQLVRAGKLRFYGVSVERVEEALKALEYPNVQSIQIIFNMFRQRPADLLFSRAKERQVGILARVPLSSGMLTGKMTASSTFAEDDHRAFNREGAAFDRGETFSGINYQAGLAAVEELRPLVPPGFSLAQLALAWILEHDAVTCVIPGAKRPAQVDENVRAAAVPALSQDTRSRIDSLYQTRIRPLVHQRW
jgi:aryl-alcohol dehydrogenase-like predicted oxidoreductase